MIDNQLLFSMFSGHNFYQPVMADSASNRVCIRHMMNNCTYELLIKKVNRIDMDLLKTLISFPPSEKNLIWPIDVIDLRDSCYSESGNVGFVFYQGLLAGYSPFKDYLYYPDRLDWRKDDIKRIVWNFTKLFYNLEKYKYCYYAFDVDKMYYDSKNYDFILDFSVSNNTYKNSTCFLDTNDVKRDFLPPWIGREDNMCIKLNYMVMRYSFAVVLFRLLIGRLPYQGRLADNIGRLMHEDYDEDFLTHHMWVDEYLSNPVFLFDENDNSNSIGTFGNEKIFLDRWESLDNELKHLFQETFSKKSLQNKVFVSIEKWYKVINELWGKQYD